MYWLPRYLPNRSINYLICFMIRGSMHHVMPDALRSIPYETHLLLHAMNALNLLHDLQNEHLLDNEHGSHNRLHMLDASHGRNRILLYGSQHLHTLHANTLPRELGQ